MRRWQRRALGLAVGLVALLALAVVGWLVLLPDTEVDPVAQVLADPDLRVVRDDATVTLAPATGGSGTTVVFYPGAGVAPDAYLPTWAPVVEATGATVVLPHLPLRLAVLDADAAADVRAVVEDAGGGDGAWWVGGHSLGGAMAASFVAEAPPGAWDGLLLWAAYPAGDGLPDRDDLAVASVAGSRDGLTTPAEVEASRAALPTDAVVTVLDGVSHAQFGAYGDQRGDGEPTVGDDEARRLVVEATVAALAGG